MKDIYSFNYRGIDFKVTSGGKVSVSEEYYGQIPHVLYNGGLCISRDIDINFSENDTMNFVNSILIYAEWLFNLPPNYRVAEMLMEMDYYLKSYLNKKCIICDKIDKTPNEEVLIVLNPNDLWSRINDLEKNIWYKIMPIDLDKYYIYLNKLDDNDYQIYFDSHAKAKMRVSGLDYDSVQFSATFIGVGSVYSYIIKNLLSKGLSSLVLVDDDTVEVDNSFRFAFPFLGLKKINAVKKFVVDTLYEYDIITIDSKIDKEFSRDFPSTDVVFVSVDNMVSWFEIYYFLEKKVIDNTKICFVGVDIFGGFGKFIWIQYSKSRIDEFRGRFLKFLDFRPTQVTERRQVLGNGCGKSIAIYSEIDLMLLAQKACDQNYLNNEVVYIEFTN